MAREGVPGYGKTCRQDVLRGVDVPVVEARRFLPGLKTGAPHAAKR
jgi:hypothetical protein